MVVLPFTKAFSQLPFQGFLDFLIKKIGMKAIVMGEDHNFGKGRAGNKETMREICAKNSIEIIIIPELTMAESKVRSSRIRQCIENKNFVEAERLLGHSLKKKDGPVAN